MAKIEPHEIVFEDSTQSEICHNENKNNRGAKLTHEQFLSNVYNNQHNASIDILDKYTDSKTKVRCRCKRCGFEWTSYPNALYIGSGCKNCFQRARSAKDDFYSQIAKINPTIEVSGEYKTNKSVLHCKCKICAYEWDIQAISLRNGYGCGVCNGKIITDSVFRKILAEVNPSVDVISEYKNTKTAVICRCRFCNHKWTARPNALISKNKPSACPECAKKKTAAQLSILAKQKRKSHDDFIIEMSDYAPTITVLGQYQGDAIKIKCRCNICGKEWESIPRCLKNNGCPQCSNKRRSELLRKPVEQFKQELSVVNPKVILVGEYLNDSTKTQFQCVHCQNIWSTTPASVLRQRSACPACNKTQTSFAEKSILFFLQKTLGENNVISRDRSIGKELDIYIKSKNAAIEYGSWYWHKSRLCSDQDKLKLCEQFGIKLIVIYDGFNDRISDYSFNNDTFMIYRECIGVFNMRHKLIDCIKDIYKKLDIIYAFSNEEENELFEKAKLATSKKTHEEFVEELYKINKDIELLSLYKDTYTPISCRCVKCGNEWSSNYNSLIRRKGKCPACGRKKKSIVDLNTGEIFESAKIASAKFNVKIHTIRRICQKRIMTQDGHSLVYLEDLTQSQISELKNRYPNVFIDESTL